LKGPVKSVTVESAKVERKGKRYEEGRRALAEKEMFDAEGNLAEGES
jgi:ubiquitin